MTIPKLLGKASLRYRHAINVVRIAFAVLGLWVFFSIPREQYPSIPLYYVHIVVPYPGANVELIEEAVTKKIETELESLTHVENVNSIISPGLSFTRVAYNQEISDAEFRDAVFELKTIMAGIEFPSMVESPIVDDFTYSDFVSIIDVIVQHKSGNQEQLMRHALNIENKLKNLDGVHYVNPKALFEKEIRIQLNRAAMQNFGVSSFEIHRAIMSQNQRIPAGTLLSKDAHINVKTNSWLASPEDLEDIVVRNQPFPLKIRDLASIHFVYNDEKQLARYNGEAAVVFKIHKQLNKDALTLVKKLKESLNIYQQRYDDDIAVHYFADSTIYVSSSIKTLGNNAMVGLLLVFIVMLLLMGARSAFIICIQIPLTFCSSFLILKWLGITLNSATLFALVLVLGMVVDHSIVVLENILHQRYRQKLPFKDAIIQGLAEMAGPVFTAFLTTVAAFIPLAFMPGIIGDFLMPVPVTIVIVFTISVLTALFVVPSQYMNFIGKDVTQEFVFFEKAQSLLKKMLGLFIRHRIITGIICVAITIASLSAFFFVSVSLFDTEDQRVFFVDITMPQGTSLEYTREILEAMEEKLTPLVQEEMVAGIVSLAGNTEPDYSEGIVIQSAQNAQLQIELTDALAEDPKLMQNLLFRTETLLSTVAGPDAVRIRKQRTGPPTTKALAFKLLANDAAALNDAKEALMQKLSEYRDVYAIRSNAATLGLEYVLHIDRDEAQKHGISVGQIGMAVRNFLGEDSIGALTLQNQSYSMYTGHFDRSTLSAADLVLISFPTENGLVPLSAIAELREEAEQSLLYRENGTRIINITADAKTRKNIKTIEREILNYFRSNHVSSTGSNVEIEPGGEFDVFTSILDDLILLFLVSIVIIYVVLTLDFKSYSQPVLIMLTIVSTAIGVALYILLSQTSLSIVILYSFLAIMGITVDGAIVLINTSNRLVEYQGMDHRKAIIQAAARRLKPIVLTNITTIVGVLPTALGIAGDSPVWKPMSITIVVGLFSCMFITLFFIPVYYSLLPRPKLQDW